MDRESLITLTQESLEKSKSIQKLEEAAADLYKALQTGRDRGLQKFYFGGRLSHIVIPRHGCWDGTTFRIQDVQFSVLQKNFGLFVHHVHCTGTWSTHNVSERS